MIDEVLSEYGEYIYGVDEYFEPECEYPEVYAKFAIALFHKWEKKHEQRYKERAYKYLERMCELGIETEKWFYWGLPFDWGNTKKSDGFLITTCFCLQALNIWDNKQWKNIIKKAKAWCFTLVFDCSDGEAGIFYSPKLRQNIYNATAMACGTLLECERGEDKGKTVIFKVLEQIIRKQKARGYWNYSDEKCDVDLLHQSYTVEGLIRSYPYICDLKLKIKVKESIDKGMQFLVKRLYLDIDKGERYLFVLSDEEKAGIKFKHCCLRCLRWIYKNEEHFPATRCWSYAALLRCLYYAEHYMDMKYKKEMGMCLEKIHTNLFVKSYFKYNRNDRRKFIRHQAHMVEALSYVNK